VVAKARDNSSVGDISYLRGKIVAVVGDVTEYRGHPEIIVRDKEQIQVAASDTPQEFDAAQPRPGGKGFPGARHGRAW
jgi:DNA/RNA endonuclease YhcR with UshA esterase domain